MNNGDLRQVRAHTKNFDQEAKYPTFCPKLLKIGPFCLFFTLGNLSLTLKTAALTFVASQEPVGGAAFVI